MPANKIILKKLIIWAAAVVLAGVAIFFVFDFSSSLRLAYADACQAMEQFSRGVDSAKRQNFESAAAAFESASRFFAATGEDLASANFFSHLPGVAREVRAIRQIALVGATLSRTAFNAANFGAGIAGYFHGQETNLGKMAPEVRREILKKIYESPPLLYGARADVDLSSRTLQTLPKGAVSFFLKSELSDLEEKLTSAKQLLDDAIPLVELFPQLAGYPQKQNYLFLLQNNTELRPSGGFIGTYGILKLDAGHITDFWTDDSYNLDRFADAKTRPVTPLPLKQYLGQERWYFRDANWSPDFKESAKLALQFYREESKDPEDIDGVIAITPDFISSMLKILGPVAADSQTFTAQNFVDALEWQVEMAYEQAGIPKPQRKAVISVLARKMIENFYKVPFEEWPELIHEIRNNLDEKHILVYGENAHLQQFVEAEGWGGRIESAAGDYLSVIDANLASLKSDPLVERSIDYFVSREGDDFIADVKINYSHRGQGFDWKTTRYRTFTRVYAPLGSELIESRGAMVKEKDPRVGVVSKSEELNKTVFGAFISIEPGENKTLKFKYKLPATVRALAEKGMYQIFVQKQAGVAERDLTISVDLGKKMRWWQPTGFNVKADNGRIEWQTKLRRDQVFVVKF